MRHRHTVTRLNIALTLALSAACGSEAGSPPSARVEVDGDAAGSFLEDASLEDCDGGERNACGGCAPLEGDVGDPCPGFECGALACADDGEGLTCDCLERDGCETQDAPNVCACREGLAPDGSGVCVDVDECAQRVCGEESTCVNTLGSFYCAVCPLDAVGVSEDGTECVLALDGIEMFSKADVLLGASETCIRADCPAGKVVVGGFHTTEAGPVSASRQAPDGNGWLTCVSGSIAAPSQATVVCAEANVPIAREESTGTVQPGEEGCHTTACPDGASILGGGGGWPEDFEVASSLPEPDASGWTICGRAGETIAQVDVEAICADISITISRDVVGGAEEFTNGCRWSICPDGRILGGGTNGGDAAVVYSAPTMPSAVSWTYCGDHSTSRDVWVDLICATGL